MKMAYRIILLLSMMVAALMGGLLATLFAPKSAQAEAAVLAFGPQVKLTALKVPNVGIDNFSSIATKVSDVGNFTVENASSTVEVTHQGKLLIENVVNTNGVYFELRVDNALPLTNTGTALVRSDETGEYVPSTFSGYWRNLAAGQHAISLWVRTSSAPSSADAIINPGNWISNTVIVKEYLPLGSTYMPLIEK